MYKMSEYVFFFKRSVNRPLPERGRTIQLQNDLSSLTLGAPEVRENSALMLCGTC